MPTIKAELNHLRVAPRKVRAVVDLLRGHDVDEAKAQLKYLTRRSAAPLEKLLDSAAANAKHNFGLDERYLYVKEIVVDEGMKLKRYKPKGFGMTMPIQKKTSHVSVVLEELPEERKKRKEVRLSQIKDVEPAIKGTSRQSQDKGVKTEPKPEIRKEVVRGGKKGVFGGVRQFGRKLFRRKSI